VDRELLQIQPRGRSYRHRTDTATHENRVLIDVEDQCGGLPPGRAEDLFLAFQQRGTDRSGLGQGLTITRDAVEANGGVVRARSLPGHGCIFTVDLPPGAARKGHTHRLERTRSRTLASAGRRSRPDGVESARLELIGNAAPAAPAFRSHAYKPAQRDCDAAVRFLSARPTWTL
jgi:hypothetical protein